MRPQLFRLARHALTVALLCLIPLRPALADVVVVVNTRSSIDQLSREGVINIFMGRYRKLPDGATALPLDQDTESPVRRAFYRLLLDKSLEEINSYWARLVFAGRTMPPKEISGPNEVLERVANDPHAIGYLDRSQLSRADRTSASRNVKVLFSLPD